MTRAAAFRAAVIAMAVLAAAKLSDELLRLVWRSGPTAAIDLEQRYRELHAWFAGTSVYETIGTATYPPATYAMLWPLLGWVDLEPARWLWAAFTLIALGTTAWIVVRASDAVDPWGRAFAALLVLAPNETGVAVGNGQFIPIVLPALLGGVILIHRGRASWRRDILAAVCVIAALVKVTLAVPFLWLVLFAPPPNETTGASAWRLRPAILVAVGYTALTCFAMTFQPAPWTDQLRGWLRVARDVAVRGGNYGDVQAWFGAVGLSPFVGLASVGLFLALGAWLFAHRHVDLWIRLGVIAIVARIWTYHRLYDDMLVVIALVALLRIARSSTDSARGRQAGLLLGATLFTMLLPARLGTAPFPWWLVFNGSHTLTWLATLAFLTREARLRGQTPYASFERDSRSNDALGV